MRARRSRPCARSIPAPSCWPRATRSAEPVLAALADADLGHLACHGSLRADNPMFSSLILADGPVTVQELHGAGVAPHRLVLASCHSGADVAYAGDEVLGFVSAMLAQGTAGVVASIAAIPDVAAVDLMLELHRGTGRRADAGAGAARGPRTRRPVDPRGLRQLVHVQRPRRRLSADLVGLGPCRTLGAPKDRRSSTVSCARSARVPIARSPAAAEASAGESSRMVRLAPSCLPSPAPARGSFVCGA